MQALKADVDHPYGKIKNPYENLEQEATTKEAEKRKDEQNFDDYY